MKHGESLAALGTELLRVISGGLIAGGVIFLSEFVVSEMVFPDEWIRAMEALNRPPRMQSAQHWFIPMLFVVGIVTVWLYSAMRHRFGSGAKTALITGILVWFLVRVWGVGGTIVVMSLYPAKLVIGIVLWGLFEVPLACLAGGWVYERINRTAS